VVDVNDIRFCYGAVLQASRVLTKRLEDSSCK
jgi:hypothetical protein